MQICRSSMQLRIKQVEEENARLKAELAELKKIQEQMALVHFALSTRFVICSIKIFDLSTLDFVWWLSN